MELIYEKLLGFFMVLTRISAFFLILPIFGWKTIPVRIKVAFTILLAVFFSTIIPVPFGLKQVSVIKSILFLANEATYGLALGLIAPQLGTVSVFGSDPRRDARNVKRRIGYVAEDQSLPPFLKVEEVLNLHRTLYPAWDDGLARQLAGQFRLPARAKIAQLSKGQARQVALLCAVAHRPELLLLDEPAGGLDPAARREFLETAIQFLNEAGSTIVFSSHHLADVERIARRVVMIHDGYLYLDSEVDDLREGYSLALIPSSAVSEPIRLLDLPDCVGVRPRRDSLHAIFRRDPDSTCALLGHELGLERVRCRNLALEEMFIELVGSFEPLGAGHVAEGRS